MKEKKFWKSEKVLFAGCDQIERIRILDHHKNFKIKKDAFENCISLRKVSFFGGIKVESGAFRNCPKLYDFALINYYEGTEVSIADDAFDADSKVLVLSLIHISEPTRRS